MTNPKLSLYAGFDRSLAWCGGKSVRYLVAEVGAEEAATRSEPKPLNLAIVVDASGSMGGSKLASAKQAANEVINSLGPQDLLSVVSFADDVQVHLDAIACADGQTDRAITICEALETRGMTNLSGGWLTGAQCVAGAMQNEGARVNRVVLLSDGQANVGLTDPEVLAGHAAELRLRGIVTSTVGIGDDYSAPLLLSLAEHGGGQMHDAERPDEIGEVLLGELRDSQAVVAENLQLTLQTPASVVSELVGFYPGVSGPGSLTAALGGLVAGRTRQAVFRLLLPEAAPGSRLTVRVELQSARPGEDVRVSAAPVDLEIELVEGARNNGQPREAARTMAVAQAWHAVAVRNAARLNRGGDRRRARSYLEREFRHFQRYAQGLPRLETYARELALMLRNIGDEWNERTRKEMELSATKSSRREPDYRAAPRAPWSDRMGRE